MAPLRRAQAGKPGGEYNQALQILCAKLNGTNNTLTSMAERSSTRRLSQVEKAKNTERSFFSGIESMRSPVETVDRIKSGAIEKGSTKTYGFKSRKGSFKKSCDSSDQELRSPSRANSMGHNHNGPTIIKKDSRQFNTYWRDKIETVSGDHRRHIPLVANMKAMLLEIYSHADELERTEEFHQILEDFLKHIKGDENEYDVETAANKVLNVLANLHSHIFLGRAEENQCIGNIANSMAGVEDYAVDAIDEASTMHEIDHVFSEWRMHFLNKKNDEKTSFSKLEEPTERQKQYHAVSQRMYDDMLEVTSGIKQSEYRRLKDFKADARAIIRHLRDTFSTDISDAGHDTVRQWQNHNWLPLHQKMMNIVENPSLKGFKNILERVIYVEQEFAVHIAKVLKQQGMEVVPNDLVMNREADLYPEFQKPVREGLTALLQQKGVSL